MSVFVNILILGFLLHSVRCDKFSITLPEQIQVWRGSCLTIPCSFTIEEKYRENLNAQCRAVWKTEDRHETVGFARATNGDLTQNNCTTTVHDVTPQQAGRVNFRLECDNPLKWTFKDKTMSIIVNEAPPTLTLTPPTVSVTEGQSVSVQCSAPVPCLSGAPALTWSPVLGQVQETLQQQQDGTFVKVSTLSFTAAHTHHEKNVTCFALYGSMTVRAELRPFVRYQPRNTSVSLKCSSDSNPAVQQYRWYKADRGAHTLIGNTAVLDIKISKVVTHIFCEAQNELGTDRSVVMRLNEQFSAQILRSSNCSGDVSRMSCVCEAEGNPSPLVQWQFSGVSANVSITNEALSDTSVRSVITVAEPRWKEPVTLVCHSSNSLGTDTQTFTVPVYLPKDRPTNTRVTVSPSGPVAEHSEVTLTCSSEANPAVQHYRWYKTDGETHTLIGNSSVLSMKATKDLVVFCEAQNDLGIDTSTVTRLDVQYSPRDTTISGHLFKPVAEDDNVTLTCSSDANPTAKHYRWYKADGAALTLFGDSAVLHFRASKDVTRIFCEAQNDLGTDRSTVAQLLVNYKPRNTRVTVQPQSPVREHSDVTLTCSSDANPAVQLYRWYKDDGGSHSLIGNSMILNMKASKDTTAVFCEAQNELGADKATVTQLDIQYQPFSTTVTVSPSGPVDEYSNVTLTCNSEANPAVQNYRWYKDDGGALTLIGNSAVLHFRASKDTSDVFCEAQNDVGTDRSSITQLFVKYKPRNTRVTVQPQSPVREHSDVTLTCSSEANPAVQLYRWYKDDGGSHSLIGNSTVLNMKASKDITAVFCEAQNELGTDNATVAQLDIQYQPFSTTVTVSPSGPVDEYSNVTLTCNSEANPAVQHYRWYKDDGGALTLIGNAALLHFRASKDTSDVFCEAQNDVGTDRSSITQLLVNYKPRNTRLTVQPQSPVREHSDVTLTCSSEANPAVQLYRWYKDDGGSHSLIGNSTVLNMKASKDSTAVFCEAQNELGTDISSVTQLDVQYQPFSTTVTVSPSGPVDEYSNVTLTCKSEANPAVQHYRWYRADGGALTLIGNSAVLHFRASQVTSDVFCEAQNDFGTDRSSITQLLVKYKPRNTRVTVQPQSPVTEHSDVTLTCSSEANPAVQLYRWYKDDGGSHSLIGNSTVLNMKASKDITAVFCEAQNKLGTDNSTIIHLDLQYSPRNTSISGLSSRPVSENGDVSLTCSSDASPAVRHYRWYKADGGSSTLIGDSAVLNMKASKDTTHIFCEALNDLGTDRSTVAQLDVQYGPRNTRVTFASPRGTVAEHSNVTLTCSSDANPTVQLYRWYKEDRGARTLIGDSAVLNMGASRDTAAVFCEAQNDLGTECSNVTQLDVQYPPTNTRVAVSPSGPVAEHSDVTLTCSSEANPAVHLYRWYRADGGSLTLMGGSAVLNMKASKDKTHFYCEAQNDLGTQNSTVTQLDVLYHPRNTAVTISPSGPVLEHHVVTLRCSSDANPAVQSYSWYTAGGTLIGNSPELKMNTSKNRTEVFCQAQNDLGTNKSAVTLLDVQFSPQILRSSNCTEAMAQISCVCEAEGNPIPMIQWHLPGISSNQSISSEPLSDRAIRSIITVTKPSLKEPFTVVCHSSNSLGTCQQLLHAQAQAFQQQGTKAGAPNNLLIAAVFILLVLVGGLVFIISRTQHVRLQKLQSLREAVEQMPESKELDEETQMNIYTSANEPPAQL